jgi:hypothetical protein
MKRTRESFTGTVIYSNHLAGVFGQSSRSQGYAATKTILRIKVSDSLIVEGRVASPIVRSGPERYGRGAINIRCAAAVVGQTVTISGLSSGRRATEIVLDSARLEVSA